jgi:hypothetical protein
MVGKLNVEGYKRMILMKSKQHKIFLHKLTFYLALFIAIGSILVGSTLCLWPYPPCHSDGPSFINIGCLNETFGKILGVFILAAGIMLMFFTYLANLPYRTLSIIGMIINFVVAITLLGSFFVRFPTDFIVYELIALIQGIGFLSAGLSANIIKTFLSRKTL